MGDADGAEDGLILLVQEQDLEARPREEAWGLASKALRDVIKAGALTLKVESPGGWQDNRHVRRGAALEIYMLDGDLSIEDQKLVKGDFVYIPKNAVYGAASSAAGATEWNFRIVGGAGEPGIRLARDAVRKHGISANVEFCGELDDEGLCRILSEAHIGIMPSHAESFGLAIAETQAAGVAVIAYDTTAVPEVVQDGVTGWLAPKGSVDGLAGCIRNAIENPAETYRRGLAAQKRVQQNFTWPATTRRILDGLDSIC